MKRLRDCLHNMSQYLLLASIAGNFASYLAEKVTKEGKNPSQLKTVFITTAANLYEDKPWMDKDIQSFIDVGFVVERVDIAAASESKLRTKLEQTEVCIVGGGNTVYMLEKILEKNLVSVFRQRVQAGMVYVGSSAGAVVAAPNISLETHFDDRSDAPKLESYDALNLCDVHVLPHWGSAEIKEEYLQKLPFCYEQKTPLLTLSDEQAVEVVDGEMLVLEK